VQAGQRVSVPLGKREVVGICLGEVTQPEFECKDILNILDPQPYFHKQWLALIHKIADYYIAPLGTVLHGVLSQKLLGSTPAEPYTLKHTKAEPVSLSAEQQTVVEAIKLENYAAHLLQGITGSGKTEVYLELTKQAMAAGKQTLYLVPEISLTPQLIERLTARLGFAPLVYHSKLTDKRRTEAFWAFARNEHPLLLGARSALFVPAPELGLIIVDEEHEASFKQEEMPSYHLRDMAVLYASMTGIPIVLGSATPQTESVNNALSGKYTLHKLDNRHGGAVLPDIELVDMRQATLVGDVLAEPVYESLYATVQAGKQAIVFLNRKGYATALFCKRCGRLHECVNCSVPLTMYKSSGRSSCNYCGTEYYKLTCPDCGCEEIFDAGMGTERVEEFLLDMFPEAVLRIDADKINTYKQLSTALEAFYNKEKQILVGTQLVAKGLHFPDVTFVGILGLDNILAMPDYRATEKAYQLVMQVSGRAGRGDSRGRVLIQTNMPEHGLFQYFTQPAEAFYQYELERRRQFGYPPYAKLARIILSYSKQVELNQLADVIALELRRFSADIGVLGPAPAVIAKIKNMFRASILVKAGSHKLLSQVLQHANAVFAKHKMGAMAIKIDRDPYYFM
jgi:primosomal protein N' (replication factor Y)